MIPRTPSPPAPLVRPILVAMPMTLAEKIIARASGLEHVRPGQIVTCRVDRAMMHDSSGPRRQAPKLEPEASSYE